MRKPYGRRSAAATIGLTLVVMLSLALALAACGSGGSSSTSGGGSAATPLPAKEAGTIVGAGATFPFPLYSKWGQTYNTATGVKLNYQAIGSGGGISAIEADTVDFGASDAPLKKADLDTNGLVQFPMCIGGVVLIVNLEGIAPGGITLDAATVARIYNGDIATWNDAAIAALNPGVSLPSTAINVVHRSDSSGTTWIFTHYLTAAAGDVWTAGADKEVAWPTGVGGKGSSGVAATVQQVAGSIGYVEYAYATQNAMAWTNLVNAEGKTIAPSLDAFTAAALNAPWKQAATDGFYTIMVNAKGATSWPITGASFILMRAEASDPARSKAALEFFAWAYASGAQTATDLQYVPIPKAVSALVEKVAWPQVTAAGQPVWQP